MEGQEDGDTTPKDGDQGDQGELQIVLSAI